MPEREFFARVIQCRALVQLLLNGNGCAITHVPTCFWGAAMAMWKIIQLHLKQKKICRDFPSL